MRYQPAHSLVRRRSSVPMPLALATALTSGAGMTAHVQSRQSDSATTAATAREVQARLAERTTLDRLTSSRTAARARLLAPLTSGSVYANIDPDHAPAIPAALLTVTSGDSRATAQARLRLAKAVEAMKATGATYAATRAAATRSTAQLSRSAARLSATSHQASDSAVAVPATSVDLAAGGDALATARAVELRAADAHRAAIHTVNLARQRVEAALAADLAKLRAAQDAEIAAGTMVRLADGSVAKAVPLGTSIPGNGHVMTAPVRGWITQALGILYTKGFPRHDDDMMNLAIIIYNESGGQPGSKNLWDSNAAKGMPSFGLMQTIGPTFIQWAMPGQANPGDPVHQIMAGARYAVAAYDSLGQVPGVRSLKAGGRYLPY